MFGEMRSHLILLTIFSAMTIPAAYLVPFPYALPLAIAACTSTLVSLMLSRWAGLWESRQRWLSASVVLSYALLVLFYGVPSLLAAIAVTWPMMAMGLALPTGLLVTVLVEAKAPSHVRWLSRLAIGLGLLCWLGILVMGGGRLLVAVGVIPALALVLGFIVYASGRQALRSFRRRRLE